MIRLVDHLIAHPSRLPEWAAASAPGVRAQHPLLVQALLRSPVLFVDEIAAELVDVPEDVIDAYLKDRACLNAPIPASWVEYRLPPGYQPTRHRSWAGSAVKAVGMLCVIAPDPYPSPGATTRRFVLAATLYVQIQVHGGALGPLARWRFQVEGGRHVVAPPEFFTWYSTRNPPDDLRAELETLKRLSHPALVAMSLVGTPYLTMGPEAPGILPPRPRPGAPPNPAPRILCHIPTGLPPELRGGPAPLDDRPN